MSTKSQNLDFNFLGILGSCIEQYIKGNLTKLEVIKMLGQNFSKEDKKNWNPKSEFKGHELIDTFLEVKGMTQADLAKETGLTTSKVNDLVKGRINITPKTAKKLASVFEVEHTTFL